MRPEPRAFLPLPAYDLHILLAVLDQPRHGYAILEDIEVRSEDVRGSGPVPSTRR